MVINFNHIFVRIPKNASTSLATFFVKNYADENSKYTLINDSGTPNKGIPQRVLTKYIAGYRFIHLTLNEIVSEGIITEQQARTRKVIGVIRDPLDRQLSLYFFLKKGPGYVNEFREMFSEGCGTDRNNKILQSDYLKIGNETVGEYWAYPNIDNHLKQFVAEHPIKLKTQLPNYKSSLRKNQDKQQLIDKYYDQKTIDAVRKYYEPDFELYEELSKQ